MKRLFTRALCVLGVVALTATMWAEPITIRFLKPADWTSVYFDAWSAEDNYTLYLDPAPGTKITATDEDGLYYHTFHDSIKSINYIISDSDGTNIIRRSQTHTTNKSVTVQFNNGSLDPYLVPARQPVPDTDALVLRLTENLQLFAYNETEAGTDTLWNNTFPYISPDGWYYFVAPEGVEQMEVKVKYLSRWDDSYSIAQSGCYIYDENVKPNMQQADCETKAILPPGFDIVPDTLILNKGEVRDIPLNFINMERCGINWESTNRNAFSQDSWHDAVRAIDGGEGWFIGTLQSDNTLKDSVYVIVNVTPMETLRLSAKELWLNKDGKAKLEATITGDASCASKPEWSFSRSYVVKYDEYYKEVVMLRNDTVTIYAKDPASNLMDSCKVYVALSGIELTGLNWSWDTDSYIQRLQMGQTFPLPITFMPAMATNKRLVFSSSDESIATVDANGVVLGKAVGSATITATSEQGNHTTSCLIEVHESSFTLVSEAYAKAPHHADINGDGMLEAFVVDESQFDDREVKWYDIKGNRIVSYMASTDQYIYNHYIHDFNNDGVVDFLFNKNGRETAFYKYIAYSTPNGTYERKAVNDVSMQIVQVADFNRDGRDDILAYVTEDRKNTPYLYIQLATGGFVARPFDLVTDVTEIDDAYYSTGSDGIYFSQVGIPVFNPAYFRKMPAYFAPSATSPAEQPAAVSAADPMADGQVLDMNMDGYPDIIGGSYISLPDGRYYHAAITGSVGIADFNEDGVNDMVIFSNPNVDLRMSKGSDIEKSVLYSNANISNVICQDMNNDGKVDILLLAPTADYFYMLFFLNNGDGTFTKVERAVSSAGSGRTFIGLWTLGNNTTPTVFTSIGNKYDHTLSRIDWDASFVLTETAIDEQYTSVYGFEQLCVRDFNGDGYLQASLNKEELGYGLYAISSEPNTVPAAGSKPEVIVDKTTGLVRVDWADGQDAETAVGELDYEIRVRPANVVQNAPQAAQTETNSVILFGKTTENLDSIFTLDEMVLLGGEYIQELNYIKNVFANTDGDLGVQIASDWPQYEAGYLTFTLSRDFFPTSITFEMEMRSYETAYIVFNNDTIPTLYDDNAGKYTTVYFDGKTPLREIAIGTVEHVGTLTSITITEGGKTSDSSSTTPALHWVQNNLLKKTSGATSIIFDPTTWTAGEYAVDIRTIDNNLVCGQWGPVTTFTHNSKKAACVVDKTMITVVDTITVTSISGETLQIEALPDGRVLSNENGVAKIMFADMGIKEIVARIEGGLTTRQNIEVEPFKLSSPDNTWTVFDLDNDGQLEGWNGDNTGLYRMSQGEGTLNPSLNMSDVRIWQDAYLIDKNRDGQPDFAGSSNTKNGVSYDFFVNSGYLDFSSENASFEVPEFMVGDLDNDGCVDYINRSGGRDQQTGILNPITIYRNKNYTWLEEYIWTSITTNCYITSVSKVFTKDINNDGYLDLVLNAAGTIAGQESAQGVVIMINKGKFEFDVQAILDFEVKDILDANGDGLVDLISMRDVYVTEKWYVRTMFTLQQNPDGSFATDFKQLDRLPLGFDFDNDGNNDFNEDAWLIFAREGGEQTMWVDDAIHYLQTNLNVPKGEDACWLHDWPRYQYAYDYDEDGYPDIMKREQSDVHHLQTVYTNTAPTAPTTIFVNQGEDEVIISWNGATDKESMLSQLRYNISIREKGTKKYVYSPLNATSNKAHTVYPGYEHYRTATTLPMPVDAFEAGKTYEICVQTIDSWYAHSDFSEVIEFTPAEQLLIYLPSKGGVDVPITFTYAANTSTPTILADGGTVSENTITWNSAGIKTVTAMAGEIVTTQSITIVDKPNLTLDLPEQVLENTTFETNLPMVDGVLDVHCSSADITLYNGKMMVQIGSLQDDEESRDIIFTVSTQDPIFGTLTSESRTTIVKNIQPVIQMLTVEGTGVRVSWQVEPLTNVHNGKVHIYKETNIADQYELIATPDFTDGTYLDTKAQADMRSSRYCLALETKDGNMGIISAPHTSIHTMINRGLGYDVNLHWTHYEGAPVAQYTILSGTSPDNLTVLDNISGNAQSYTHKRASDADTYYALAYTLKSAMAAPSIVHRGTRRAANNAAALEGRSNVICSNEAYNVTLVESIAISARENSMMLTNNQSQLHLLATVEPVRATLARVAWSVTAGEDYAAISSDGVLSIIATENFSGMITVQAKAVDGSEVTTTANIPMSYTVPAETVAVTGVLMSHTGCTLNVGETLQLTANIEPANATNKNVTWKSTNTNVATVEDGLITALAEGTAVVSVTTEDGGFQAGCFVTVIGKTDLDNVEKENELSVRKIFHNGTIYIIRNGNTYTTDGRKVNSW